VQKDSPYDSRSSIKASKFIPINLGDDQSALRYVQDYDIVKPADSRNFVSMVDEKLKQPSTFIEPEEELADKNELI
jgi:hypothetical protein